MKIFTASIVAVMVICNAASSQTMAKSFATTASLSARHFNNKNDGTRIHWTWQLPRGIRKAFDQSRFCTWYIEKMTSYNKGGRTIYTFYLDNSSLLDGDHHDCFLKQCKLTVADDGKVDAASITD